MAIEFSVNPVVTAATQQTTGAAQGAPHASKPAAAPTPAPASTPASRQGQPAHGQHLPQAGGSHSPPAKKQSSQAPSDANKYAQSLHRKMVFTIDPVTGAVVVKIVDSVTNEVIREIPEDEVPYLVRQLEHVQGQLLKVKA